MYAACSIFSLLTIVLFFTVSYKLSDESHNKMMHLSLVKGKVKNKHILYIFTIIAISFLTSLTNQQITTNLPLYIQTYTKHSANVYSTALLLNTIILITLQKYVVRYKHSIYYFAFPLGMMFLCFPSIHVVIVAIVLYTLGEMFFSHRCNIMQKNVFLLKKIRYVWFFKFSSYGIGIWWYIRILYRKSFGLLCIILNFSSHTVILSYHFYFLYCTKK